MPWKIHVIVLKIFQHQILELYPIGIVLFDWTHSSAYYTLVNLYLSHRLICSLGGPHYPVQPVTQVLLTLDSYLLLQYKKAGAIAILKCQT